MYCNIVIVLKKLLSPRKFTYGNSLVYKVKHVEYCLLMLLQRVENA